MLESSAMSSPQSPSRYFPGLRPDEAPGPDSLVFAFHERRLLMREETEGPRLPRLEELGAAPEGALYLGRWNERPVLAWELGAEAALLDGAELYGLRRLGLARIFDETLWGLAGRAVQLVEWDRDHRFCGRCGGATEDHPQERAKRCPRCELHHYPRLAPAIIVLVERDREMLLGRSPRLPGKMFSTLAGFVEPGETLEEAVVREVAEEAGVVVGEMRYFGSQPWPFPHSLMIGFHARHLSGEIEVDGEEIEEAGWFTAARS